MLPDNLDVSRLDVHEISAKQGFYAMTRWSADDVQTKFAEQGREISPEEAEAWLIENADYIVEAMVAAGWNAIEALM